ncbi:MAG: type II secretion system protein GspM [Geminicoccaceae bacterium]
MMVQTGSFLSRTLAVAILALVLFGIYHVVIMPVWDRYVANEHRIEQMSNLLQRYRALEAERPGLETRLAEIENQDELVRGGYWEGESDIQTATRLQDRASGAVEDHGGSMISMQALEAEEVEEGDMPVRRTLLRMRLATTVDGLAATVHDIETAVPYMFIDQLIISPQRAGRRFDGQAETVDPEQKLDVRLNVFGYVREQASPPTETEG